MSIGAIILLATQASAPVAADATSQPIAVRATASVEILAATTVRFADWDELAERLPAAVQVRRDMRGTTWLEFS